MSAFMVGKEHIDAMITAGLAFSDYSIRWDHPGYAENELTYETADGVGLMLWATNLESINARYPDTLDDFDNIPGPVGLTPEVIAGYRWERINGVRFLDPVVILKAIDCYEYQSCEHDGWETSEAKAFCAALRADMIERLPGYNTAPWEFTARTFDRLRVVQ